MAAATYWFQLASLFLFYFVVQPAAWIRMPRKFPCDVHVTNSTNSTEEIILNCQGRELQEIPQLSPYDICRNATSLNLEENRITNVTRDAFSHLKKLTFLNLNWLNHEKMTYFAEGAFNNLTNLRELRMNGHHLMEIPKQLPSKLETLMLNNNNITSLNGTSLSGITSVKRLHLSNNCFYSNPCGKAFTIEHGSFSALTNLSLLNLNFNNLTHVPQGLPKCIKTLQLASNQIQHISAGDFQNLTHLKILELQGNCPRCQNAPYPCVRCQNISLAIDGHAFDGLTKLEILDLAGNSLHTINSSWFHGLTNLKKLFLSFNLLSKAIASNAGDFLSLLPKLEKMDISFNFDFGVYPKTIHISKHFSKLVSLKTLHIEGLVFREIDSDSLRPLYGLRNLSVLNLGTNFIVRCNSSVFNNFLNLKLLYLTENRFYPVTVTGSLSYSSGQNHKSALFKPPLLGFQSNGREMHYTPSHKLVSQECYNSGRVLSFSSNNVFFISPKQFEGYGDIACLNLSRNGFAAALNGTEFSSLLNLRYLDLSYNKVDLAYDDAFSELHKLEILDLSYNQHYFVVSGVTHNFNFLRNLPALKVLNLSHNGIFTLTTKEMYSASLNVLNFQVNNLGQLWKERDGSYNTLFTHLVNLTYLDISFNHIRSIPPEVYRQLPQNITKLCISNNAFSKFHWENLENLTKLLELDLSYNSLDHVSADLSKFTKTLQFLNLSHNHIAHLSNGFLKDAKSLTTLDLSYNQLSIIQQTTFLSGAENFLKTLHLQGNPFHCTCDLLEFILWIEGSDVAIPRLTNDVKCFTPDERRGQAVIYIDIRECLNNKLAFLIYSISTFIVLITMIMGTTAHLFYWDASYTLQYLKAKLNGYRSLKSVDTVYDAFIAYDTGDPQVSEWVLEHLRSQLEDKGETRLSLCLEERDWTPGLPLVDNLTTSIRHSCKTVFVLTEAYAKTGGFRLAIYQAHQRLLEENVDVIVLLLLEPVLQYSSFLRLRRRLCGSSVVEWPRNAAAEPWFWQHLRNAIRTDNQSMYSEIYSRYFNQR